MYIDYYLYYLYYTLLGYPFIIRVAIIGLCVFTPFFLYAVFKLIQAKARLYQKNKLNKSLDNKYIKNILFIMTSKVRYSLQDIGKILKCNVKKLTDKKKRLLTNKILHIKNTKTFINEKNYEALIEYFGLNQFWEKKLKYGNFSSKNRALRKLDDLAIEIPGSVVTSLTYNRNKYLRKKSRAYYMHFSKNDPFKFLDENFDRTFNEWDKIEIHRMLKRKEKDGLPNFTQWILNSDNVDFQCFLVDEIKYFKQKGSVSYLVGLLETPYIELRKHCVEALGELECSEAEEYLIKNYTIQPVVIQQSIVKAIGKLNTGRALDFLKDAYYSAHDNESRLIIAKAIFNYGSRGKQVFASMKEFSGGFSKLIFEHVSNPLIKTY